MMNFPTPPAPTIAKFLYPDIVLVRVLFGKTRNRMKDGFAVLDRAHLIPSSTYCALLACVRTVSWLLNKTDAKSRERLGQRKAAVGHGCRCIRVNHEQINNNNSNVMLRLYGQHSISTDCASIACARTVSWLRLGHRKVAVGHGCRCRRVNHEQIINTNTNIVLRLYSQLSISYSGPTRVAVMLNIQH